MTEMPTSVRLDADLKDALQKEATLQRRPLSQLITIILEDFIAAQKKAKK